MGDFLTAPRGELLKLVYELIDENEFLKIRITELREENQKLRENLQDKGKPSRPSFVKPNVKKKKKDLSLRKKRERGFARKLDLPTKQEFHSFEVCPDCGGPLGKPSVAYKKQVVDLPQTSFTVTEHVVFKRWCVHCQKRVSPKLNLQDKVVGSHRFGLNLFTNIAILRERFRLPVRGIKLYFKTFYRLDLSEGEIVEILHKAAYLSQPKYDQILKSVKASPFICGDETGFREDGQNGYLWNFTTKDNQLVFYRKSRGSKVVREIVGEDGQDYEGVVVSDFYSAYNEHAGFHQRCWAHLLKDIRELREQHPNHPPLNIWAKKIRAIYQEAKDYQGPDSNLPLGLQAQERIQKETYFKEKLNQTCQPYLTKSSPMSGLSGRINKFLPELFTFIRFPDIPSTNNLAERTLRHHVVQRKIFGGTRSEKGSQTKAILGSLFGTWNLQSLNPLQEMRLLLARAPCQ
jgi:transposase